jgi:hypothetical protein
MYLKLATWTLYRFRQLTHSTVNAPVVERLLIPEHPAQYSIETDPDYQEALGMTRLYSALANVDTHPELLCHIFHEIGKASYEGRLASSHPGVRPLPEPPIPVLRYVIHWKCYSTDHCLSPSAYERFPWLRSTPFDDPNGSDDMDTEGNGGDGDASIAMALDDMVISAGQGSVEGLRDAPKRKRTRANALSPPKVMPLTSARVPMMFSDLLNVSQADGGRGYPKRPRANSTESFRRPSSPPVRPTAGPLVSITVTRAPTGGKDICIEDMHIDNQGSLLITMSYREMYNGRSYVDITCRYYHPELSSTQLPPCQPPCQLR